MGRLVSCRKCGAWTEVDGKQPAPDFVCAKCGAAAAIHGGAPAEPAPAAPSGEAAKPPRRKGLVIGSDSGAIGTSALSSGGGLSQELEELGLRMKAEQASASKTLSQEAKNGPAAVEQSGPGSLKGKAVVIGAAAAGAAGAVAASVGEKFKEEGRQTLAQARQLGRQEAHQVVSDATEFVKEKGLSSPRQAGVFVKHEAVKIGQDVRQAAEQQVRETATRVGQKAHEAIDQLRAKHDSARQPHGQDGIGSCRLCQDRIVGSDKVVTCPECGATYHQSCYELAGSCPQCRHGSGTHLSAVPEPKITPTPGVRPVPVAKPAAPAHKVCSGCGTEAPPSALVCPQCGRWLYSGRPGEKGQGGSSGKSLPSGCVVAAVIGFIIFVLVVCISGRH